VLEQVRGEGLFRMIHHLLGEDEWWSLMKEMFTRYRFREITAEQFLALAETYYGKPLDWFAEQWLKGNALPSYEITLADARVVEDKRDFSIRYDLEVRVKNHETGLMAVPVYIQTEMDDVLRDVWLDAGEESVLMLSLPHRPIFASVDPENWVVQEPYLDQVRNRRIHSEQRVYIEGEENTPGRGSRRGGDRDRRGRGWWH
jgi:hypothetical protein